MEPVKVRDKIFKPFISSRQISKKIEEISSQINNDLKGEKLLFIGVLNGSFMFAADLFRRIKEDAEISFLKLSSYDGLESSGSIRRLIGLSEDLSGKTVIVIEDIIDTGRTLQGIVKDLKAKGARSIKVVTLLLKPGVYKGDYKIDYVGFEIPDNFVVGYGLDYDGFGRNLDSIYSLTD